MLETGAILQNRYEIIKPIGQGGMGAVYLAKDQRLGNTVALKETFFLDAVLLAAFEREAKMLAGLRHTALPKVIDHFADTDGQFLVMEYISGEDLQDLLDGGRMPSVDEVIQWADQLLDALDYLHSQQPPIIHRDIKPQNLKLTSRNQIVLLDFGLAKGSALELTNAGSNSNSSIFGYTPSYAPLEQIRGWGTDPQSDIYSLAATLYHLLTGRKPADALTRATSVLDGQADPLDLACEVNSQISARLSQLVMRGIALKKSERPLSAAEMRRMLRDCDGAVKQNAVKQSEATEAQADQPRAKADSSIRPAALMDSSTQVLASTPTAPAAESIGAGSYATRASASNVNRSVPVRVSEKSLSQRRPLTAAQRPSATIEMVSRGEASPLKPIAAVVAMIVAVIAIIYALKPSRTVENANSTSTVIHRIEHVTSPEQSGGARSPSDSPAAASPRIEATVSNEQPVAQEESEEPDDRAKAKEPESKETAGQRAAAQEDGRANGEPADSPRRPEEMGREEGPRPIPPPDHLHRPPPHPFPPPPGMPPPERRRP